MKVCRHCHRVNADGTTKCINCGRSDFEKLWLVKPRLIEFMKERQNQEKHG